MMTRSEQLAAFVGSVSYATLSENAVRQLKIRLLDTLGCAFGALSAPMMRALREHTGEFSPEGPCTLIGGGRAAPDRAAFFNGALVRYLDFNDSYMAAREYAHPSDNVGAVLAAAEYKRRSGKDFLTAMALAYQVQLRLVDEAAVLARGFDHTVQGAYALACGVSKALGLTDQQTANAIGMAGTSFNSLRVTRTGTLSNWKGLAYANTAFGCTHAALLAMRGITGPIEVFEGNKGFIETIAGPFTLDWSAEDLESVTRTSIKRYNGTIDSQSSIDAMLKLRAEHAIDASRIERIDVDIFKLAYDVIGGGEEGDKYVVKTKEQADHSLRYMIACACLDGQMMPEQYTLERIHRGDVQSLLKKVQIRPNEEYTRRFPEQCPVRIEVVYTDGSRYAIENPHYAGYYSNPMQWDDIVKKFRRLTADFPIECGDRIIDVIDTLDSRPIADLTALLSDARPA